mmetsp:Transcript_69266/g.192914  ORF Transcript_69266/g.192914 Transcript_69266/m.192914 type:complete len:335 (-) Transcript_69266:1917-2921(-)
MNCSGIAKGTIGFAALSFCSWSSCSGLGHALASMLCNSSVPITSRSSSIIAFVSSCAGGNFFTATSRPTTSCGSVMMRNTLGASSPCGTFAAGPCACWRTSLTFGSFTTFPKRLTRSSIGSSSTSSLTRSQIVSPGLICTPMRKRVHQNGFIVALGAIFGLVGSTLPFLPFPSPFANGALPPGPLGPLGPLPPGPFGPPFADAGSSPVGGPLPLPSTGGGGGGFPLPSGGGLPLAFPWDSLPLAGPFSAGAESAAALPPSGGGGPLPAGLPFALPLSLPFGAPSAAVSPAPGTFRAPSTAPAPGLGASSTGRRGKKASSRLTPSVHSLSTKAKC